METQARDIWIFLVCIGDECICFHNLFFHSMLWRLLFCVLQNLGRWAKTKCWSDQALAAIYNFLSPKLPNILALFFQPSQYSLEYSFISCLISHALFIDWFIQIFQLGSFSPPNILLDILSLMSYFTCFVYQFIHPNIFALFF